MSEDEDASAEALARVLCALAGIDPIDQMDGGANWFMFYNDSKKLLDDLRSRGFTYKKERPA